MKHSSTKGFLISQMLVVVAVIGVLGAVVVTSVSEARKRARDTERIHGLNQIHGALQLYYADHKKYPKPDPETTTRADVRFAYLTVGGSEPYNKCGMGDIPTNTDLATYGFRPVVHATADLSDLDTDDPRTPQDFLPILVSEGYLAKQWVPPSTPGTLRYECIYVVDKDEYDDGPEGNIQNYLLHCNLETGVTITADRNTIDPSSPREVSDGGLNDSVYEIYSPGKKSFCAYGNDGMGVGADISESHGYGPYMGP